MVIESIPGTMIERLQSQEAFKREPPADQNDLLLVRGLASAFQANLTEMAALKDTWSGSAPATGLTPAAATLEKTAQALSRQITGDDSRIAITLVDSVLAQTRQLMSVRDSVATLGLPGFFNGTFLETIDAVVTSNGTTVTMTLEQRGGGDLTMRFSDGRTTFDCTPAATLVLTPGTDPSPQSNFVYILQSAKILEVSTSDWPVEEHIKVAYFLVPTASLVNTGAPGNNYLYSNHNWNDHSKGTDGQGHLSHLTEQARQRGAKWRDGCLGAATQDGNDLWVSVASGTVYQMHRHSFAALDSDTAGAGDTILVVNDPDAAYTIINSLNSITKHSDGSAIGLNKYVKFVLVCVANKSGEVSPMLLNLPSGHYNTQDDAATDVDGLANFSIPTEFQEESTTGFLNAAFVCKHTASAMEIQQTIDLRGQITATATGSGTGGGDVSAHAALTDNAIVRGDGGAKDVQDSGVTIDDSDNVTTSGRVTAAVVEAGTLENTAGLLRIQPGAQGNATLFDTNYVDDESDGKSLYLYRKASEGHRLFRIWITKAQLSRFYTDADLQIEAAGYVRVFSGDDITLDLGDNAGAKKLKVRDSDFAEVATIDSDGNSMFNGVMTVMGLATGGYTDYDLKVGDTVTPDYGMIQIGNAAIGRTSYKFGAIDLDGAVLIRNIGGPVTGEIEFIIVEATGGTCRLAIPKSAVGNATYHPRSMLIVGPAPADTDFVKVSYWQTLGSFHNLLCDTDGSGADLGVQNDLEVEGKIWVNEIEESTPGANLKLQAGAGGHVTLFEDTDVADAAAGQSLFIHRKAVEGDDSLRLYVANDGDAVIDASDALSLISGIGKVLWLLSGDDVILGLGDDAGATKVEVQDVNLNVVGAWDSNGNITLDGTVDGRDVAADGTTLDGMEAFAIAMAVALG